MKYYFYHLIGASFIAIGVYSGAVLSKNFYPQDNILLQIVGGLIGGFFYDLLKKGIRK